MFDEMFIYSENRSGKAELLDNDEDMDNLSLSMGSSDIEEEKKTVEFRDRKVCIPYLMMLGLLYCPSNNLQRAEKFYELVEIELTSVLTIDDPEFVKYVPIMYEISYILMFRLYEKHREPGVDPTSKQELMPEVDLGEVLPAIGKEFEHLNSALKKVFT
jgi:hypothetical protein